MGSRRIQCPSCGQAYVLTDDEAARFAGQMIECSQCSYEIAIDPPGGQRANSIGLTASPRTPAQSAAPPRMPPAQPPPPFNPPEVTAGAYPVPATGYTVPPMPMAMAAQQQHDLRANYTDEPDGTVWAIASIVCALIGLVLPVVPGAIAILLGLIGLLRAKSSRTFAGGGLSLSGIAAGILTILFGSAVIHNYVMPAIANARSAAGVRDVTCSQHFDQISRALRTYASNHDGHFPDQIGALVASGDLQPEMLICPRTGDTVAPGTTPAHRADAIAKGGHCSYIYCGAGLTTDSPAECVLMYEPLDRHKEKGITVIFVDGRVAPIGEIEAAKALRRLSAGQNPPWSQ